MAKFLKYKWAENGTIDVVPNLLDPSGFVSYQEGYGADYSRILGTDPLAKPVERKKLNGVLNDLTGILQLYQVHGVPDFISTTANGGTAFAYDINAMVRYTDGKVYINALAGNTNLPTGTGWNIVPNNIANKLGDATQIFKVADAINADEAVSKGQLVTTTPLAGSNVEQVSGKKVDVIAVADTIALRDTNTAIAGKNQCTAWAEVDGNGTILNSFNANSVVRVATGNYHLDFIDTMDLNTMAFTGSRRYATEFNPDRDGILITLGYVTNGVSISTAYHSGTNGTFEDSRFTIVCYGGK